MILLVNSIKKIMKKFLFASLILLNGCFPTAFVGYGFYGATTDVTVKSREVLSGAECQWRCYKNKKEKKLP